jgi:Na+(H+)/acetate symporter ActP
LTGALVDDVYGRILCPQATPEQRRRVFRIGALALGLGTIIAGTCVEPFEINFLFGQALAVTAASCFPLFILSIWWRRLTMKGAAMGMLAGGLLAAGAISLTSLSDLHWINLAGYWAAHPALRILCEQPALWAVPVAFALMVFVSKLNANQVSGDARMKMLALHAPEPLGLKSESIQEHPGGH